MPPIKVNTNIKLELVTYSTKVVVNGNTLNLSITKHLGYQKPYQLNHELPLPEDFTGLESQSCLNKRIIMHPFGGVKTVANFPKSLK